MFLFKIASTFEAEAQQFFLRTYYLSHSEVRVTISTLMKCMANIGYEIRILMHVQ